MSRPFRGAGDRVLCDGETGSGTAMYGLTLAFAMVAATAGELPRGDAPSALRTAANCAGYTRLAWSAGGATTPRVRAQPRTVAPRRLDRPRAAPCFRLASA